MSETSFASLSPTLLARKGGARPAMRPQIAPLHPEQPGNGATIAANLEDLGWNDMGETHDEHSPTDGLAGLTPEPRSAQAEAAAMPAPADKPEVRRQQEEIAARIAADAKPQDAETEGKDRQTAEPRPVAETRPAASERPARSTPVERKSAIAQGRRAAFTLRLDAERHLKLRLASTVRGRSAQALVTEALDRLLKDMPEIDSMAAQVAGK
jgi:hypothetical protein